MSLFENKAYRWRETYFVMFPAAQRPTVTQLERLVGGLDERFTLSDLQADDDGHFESVTILAPGDGAAIDLSYAEGDEVVEEAQQLVAELSSHATSAEMPRIKKIAKLDARLDVLHFQEIDSLAGDEDEADEMFDPSSLLLILDALVDLTQGIAIDPQSGTLV